jgi:hypothetical protein
LRTKCAQELVVYVGELILKEAPLIRASAELVLEAVKGKLGLLFQQVTEDIAAA